MSETGPIALRDATDALFMEGFRDSTGSFCAQDREGAFLFPDSIVHNTQRLIC